MNTPLSGARQRPLSLDGLRSFEAVARLLSFSAAAEEMHLTQPAISRQIKGLEQELGASLFNRGTRKVELTAAGHALLRSVAPLLTRLDTSVRQIRMARSRTQVSLTTFPSFASLWLMPRLVNFERQHPKLDIRISATDRLVEVDDAELDLALRSCMPDKAPGGAIRLFDEVLTPVVGARLADAIARGEAPPLRTPADMSEHTLLEMDDGTAQATAMAWPTWLEAKGLGRLQPRRWISVNFTHQQMQAALAGQGVALARLPMVHDALARGEIVEPFGESGRLGSPYSYWLIPLGANPAERPELQAFTAWLLAQSKETCDAVGCSGRDLR
ncbi:LysR substrate-binding domain-containing protein [Ideonella azotifigens]|uniref:LysR substrate-binding domain-containing protein n=2 Tax=Ideonella azotifigens TaxID=513160 RepID=A0ABN1K9D1_9BURK|nr:LysR substrate-binding domain-containing protein [Ideonella azotifigens]MCD2339070.1 LysR substrate-binding domain-containing protein [Ideonella azotifigens]